MANKATVALTHEQFNEFMDAMRNGGSGFRANEKIAFALMLEANLGLRISDILSLTPKNFIKDGERYRIDIVEQKTDKTDDNRIPEELYFFILDYCEKHNIKEDERLVAYTERNIQKYLAKVCDYLGYDSEYIGTHSFRKFFATDIYVNNDYDIALVQKLLRHSTPAVTQKYIGIHSKQMENALQNHLILY